MFKVYGKESARDAYKAIKMFGEFKSEAAVKDLIDEIKREVRRWANDNGRTDDGYGHRIIKENGIDGYIELVSLPDELCTMKEAERYFKENVYIESVPSMYDCTGRAFTSWYKLFMKQSEGSFYAYHSVCFDV